MLILLSIDEEESSSILSALLEIEGVSILSENPSIGIPLGGLTIPEPLFDVLEAAKNFDVPYLAKDLVGCKSTWFIYTLSLSYRASKFCYHDAILLWLSRVYLITLVMPFIKRLYYRKAFMKLKTFTNIRRCYSF